MISVKDGVIFKKFTSPVMDALPKIDAVFRRHGRTATITSAYDGEHMKTSLHYKHLALDLRRNGIPAAILTAIFEDLQNVLGPDWDVVLEKTHIHSEYDPK